MDRRGCYRSRMDCSLLHAFACVLAASCVLPGGSSGIRVFAGIHAFLRRVREQGIVQFRARGRQDRDRDSSGIQGQRQEEITTDYGSVCSDRGGCRNFGLSLLVHTSPRSFFARHRKRFLDSFGRFLAPSMNAIRISLYACKYLRNFLHASVSALIVFRIFCSIENSSTPISVKVFNRAFAAACPVRGIPKLTKGLKALGEDQKFIGPCWLQPAYRQPTLTFFLWPPKPTGFLDLLKKSFVENPILRRGIPHRCKFFRPINLYAGQNLCVKFCLEK